VVLATGFNELLNLGRELGQGYAIAKPMPADALQAWVRDRPGDG